jgi:hypothetical protein
MLFDGIDFRRIQKVHQHDSFSTLPLLSVAIHASEEGVNGRIVPGKQESF